MATDKVIAVFVLLIVLSVVGAIVATVYDPNGRLGKKIISQLPSISSFNTSQFFATNL